ncbi:MAG: hypothetical protein BJ554DRAFT_8152 [Olpidium bornovanus]|uniref:Uncharacterized protein n=1 Tax=Olpidium bornovanus TaxID=278681 RepID=A0A8H8DIT8_9FUNG|nr:MAG: hypothetical protein BJ554DRAFT_8152 [Olpidium bornovanus]
MPTTYSEKEEFRNLIRSGARSADDDNFEEAAASVLRVCSKTKVPLEVREIFADAKCTRLDEKSTNFWIIVRAIRDFVAEEGEGLLPLPGGLPDMKADTDRFIRLQNVYKQKARDDAAAVMNHVFGLLETLGRPRDSIPMDEVEMFCKHAAVLKVMRYRSLAEEYSDREGTHRGKEIGKNFSLFPQSVVW